MAPTKKERKAEEDRKNAELPKPAPKEDVQALRAVEAQVASFGKNIEGLRERIAKLEQEKGIKDIKIKHLQDFNNELMTRYRPVEQSYKDLQPKYKDLLVKYNLLDVEHKDLQEKHKSLRKKVPTSNIFSSQTPAPLTTNPFKTPIFSFPPARTMAHEDLKDETTRMKLSNEEDNKKMQALYDELDGSMKLNKKLSAQVRQNDHYKVQFESLQTWTTSLEHEKHKASESLKAEKDKSRHLQETVNTLKLVEKAAGDEHEVQEKKISHLENQVKLRDDDVDSGRARIRTVEAQLKAKIDDYDRLHTTISEASSLARESDAKVQVLQSNYDTLNQNHIKNINNLNAKLTSREVEIEELKQEIEFKNSIDEIGITDPTTKIQQRRNSKERTLFDDLEGNDLDSDESEHDSKAASGHDPEHDSEHPSDTEFEVNKSKLQDKPGQEKEPEDTLEHETKQKSRPASIASSRYSDLPIPPIYVPLPDSPLLPPSPPTPEPIVVERWRETNVRCHSAINTNPFKAWWLVYQNVLVLILNIINYINGNSMTIPNTKPTVDANGATVTVSINASGELVKTMTEKNGNVTIEVHEKVSRPPVLSTLGFFTIHVLIYIYIYFCWRERRMWLSVNGIPQHYLRNGFDVRAIAQFLGEIFGMVYKLANNVGCSLNLVTKKHHFNYVQWVYQFERKHFGEINRGILG